MRLVIHLLLFFEFRRAPLHDHRRRLSSACARHRGGGENRRVHVSRRRRQSAGLPTRPTPSSLPRCRPRGRSTGTTSTVHSSLVSFGRHSVSRSLLSGTGNSDHRQECCPVHISPCSFAPGIVCNPLVLLGLWGKVVVVVVTRSAGYKGNVHIVRNFQLNPLNK